MRKIFIPAAAIAALAVAGCGSDNGGGSSNSSGEVSSGTVTPKTTTQAAPTTAAKPAVDVTISNFKFGPPAVAVKTGGTVTWTNKDSAAHTATAEKGGTFDTGTLNQGDSKKVTFSKAGTFAYICSFHPFMKGTVVVR